MLTLGEFGVRAKAFGDTLLTDSVVSILQRWEKCGSRIELNQNEKAVVKKTAELIDSTQNGFMISKGKGQETGFIGWMNSLSNFQDFFSAMNRALLIEKEADVLKKMQQMGQTFDMIQKGKKPPPYVKDAIRLFRELGAVYFEMAKRPTSIPPQKLSPSIQHEALMI